MTTQFPLAEIDSILAQDPGDPSFVEYGEFLRRQGNHGGALVVLFRGLARSPSAHRGRLSLARTLYEIGLPDQAADEIKTIIAVVPKSETLTKLLYELCPQQRKAEGIEASSRQHISDITPASSAIASEKTLPGTSRPIDEVTVGELEISFDDISFDD
jgi:predicted Zn-dependent protease